MGDPTTRITDDGRTEHLRYVPDELHDLIMAAADYGARPIDDGHSDSWISNELAELADAYRLANTFHEEL